MSTCGLNEDYVEPTLAYQVNKKELLIAERKL